MEALSAHLNSLMAMPQAWRALAAGWLPLLAFHEFLRYAYTGVSDLEISRTHRLLYLLMVRTNGAYGRSQLEDQVARQLDSDMVHIEVLMPFLVGDPDPSIVATAAADIATLMPIDANDELYGPNSVAEIALQFADNDELRAAAMISGLLQLSDHRLLESISGCWGHFGPAGKAILVERHPSKVSAMNVEFFLSWIASVSEDDFGHPAKALALLGGRADWNGVVEQRRKFPAPFNLTDEEFNADLPIKDVQSWSKNDFAVLIEPRLRIAYLRETYDKVLPRVLEAWDIVLGTDDRNAQEALIVAAFEKAAANLLSVSGEDMAAEKPNEELRLIASYFRVYPIPVALIRTLKDIWRLRVESREVVEQAQQRVDPDFDHAKQLIDRADRMELLARHFFGPFRDDLGETVGMMSLLWKKHRPSQPTSELPEMSWLSQIPINEWPLFAQAAFQHTFADGEATAVERAKGIALRLRSELAPEHRNAQIDKMASDTILEAKAKILVAMMAMRNAPERERLSLILDAFSLAADSRALAALLAGPKTP
ncbi:MAG: hypothetical protein QM692_11110 [Thermomicrobiales bacterium]